MTRPSLVLGLCAIGVCAAPLAADEAERLANLSKSAFLAEYEDDYIERLEIMTELLRRFDLAHAEIFDADTPVTAAERASFECLYDAMAEQGALRDLAQPSIANDLMMARIETDPDFDYLYMMHPDHREALEAMTPTDTMAEAMDGCGSEALMEERVSFTDQFWADFNGAALERGYLE